MDGFVEKMLDVLIALAIFFALIGVIIGFTNGLNWSALNVGGTVTSFSWVPYILILVVLIGTVVLTYRYMLKHKGR